MTRALVTELVDALVGVLDKKEGLATQFWSCSGGVYEAVQCDKAITAAREYLATEPIGERAELIERLRDRRAFGMNMHGFDIRLLHEAADMLEADAQQAKRVPMTMAEITSAWGACIDNRNRVFEIRTEFARAIEAHHGITQADKPTDWSAA